MLNEQEPLGSGFSETTTAREIMAGHDVTGLNVLITGGHSGIGLEDAKLLAKGGARVHVGARDIAKAADVLKSLPNVSVDQLDLADPESVDRFAKRYPHEKLDLLINNAGIMATPFSRDKRGFELQFATNHFGHFQLTGRHWKALVSAKGARVITLASAGHRFSPVVFDDIHFERRAYDKWLAYGQSKTANALFAVELDRRGEPFGIRAFSVHPGRIPSTSLLRYMSDEEQRASHQPPADGVRLKTIEQGAATTLWAALSPQLENKGGLYCADCDVGQLVHEPTTSSFFVRDYAVDPENARKLWNLSEVATGVRYP
jgi:NAD(P)-dependent dehydrogenase (short-subunit alcohol dehydrogenase family)